MEHFAVSIVDWLTPRLNSLGAFSYWLALFSALLETTLGIGLLLPGSTVILLLGALAGRGLLDFGDLLFFAVVGAVLGDNLNYFLGKRYGRRWLQRGIWFLKPDQVAAARAFFDAHGAKSVFLGRFVPSVKEVLPFIAGLVQMRQRTFMLWNVLGGIGWGLQWLGAGYLFAQSLNLAQVWLSRMGFLLAALFVFLLAGYGLKRYVQKYGHQALAMAASLWGSLRQALAANPELQRFRHRHPALCRFLGERLARDRFTGLPLTLLAIAFGYLLGLFGGVVEDLLAGDPIVAIDHRLASLLAALRTPPLVRFFLWVTALGIWPVVAGVMVAAAGVLWLLRERYLLAGLMVSTLGSVLFTWLGKLAFHRPRPADPVYLAPSFSFPSGHATIAVSLYGFLAYVLLRRFRSWPARVNIVFAALVLILAIGFSRLYLGVHYLSDVWSGYLLGGLWLVIGISLSQYLRWRLPTEEGEVARGRRLTAAALCLMALLWYGGVAARFHPAAVINKPSPQLVLSRPLAIFAEPRLKYLESIVGDRVQPVQFVILAADEQQVLRSLTLAGWRQVDRLGARSILKLIQRLALGKPYPAAPVSPLFWDGRLQDVSLAKPVAGDTMEPMGQRYYLRLWRSGRKLADGEEIYLAATGRERFARWQLVPRLSPDLDAAREELYRSLLRAGVVADQRRFSLVAPQVGKTFTGQAFFTDGNGYLLHLEVAAKPVRSRQ